MSFDIFNKDLSPLKKKKLFLLDMDGTIYNEERLFPETPPFLDAIASVGRYIFITNNSSKSVGRYVEKLAHMGIRSTEYDFYTSTLATGAYLLEHYPNQTAYCIGTRDFVAELKSMGVKVSESIDDKPELVVAAFDRELTYRKLREASELLTRGLPFIAANPDRACPVSFGFEPDCGAICEALYFATSRRPVYIGKPETFMIEHVISKSGFTKDQALIVGDRLYTDIACGINSGVDTVCVLSGEAKLKDIEDGDIKPTWTLSNIADITRTLLEP